MILHLNNFSCHIALVDQHNYPCAISVALGLAGTTLAYLEAQEQEASMAWAAKEVRRRLLFVPDYFTVRCLNCGTAGYSPHMDRQIVLNTFASDVFRKQADCDYIAARSNYRLRLRQQFLWSAQQAIEKYLKAILLFNGKSSRRYIHAQTGKKTEYLHDLDALLADVKKLPLFRIDIEPEDDAFISYLSKLGPNRYLSRSSYNTAEAIHRLDRLVWSIRRYCQFIPDRGLGAREVVPGLQAAFVRMIEDPKHKQTPHKFSLIGGELEVVVKRSPRDPTRKALVWANLWYGKKKRSRVTYNSFSSSEVAPVDREWQGVDWTDIDDFVRP